MEDSKHIYNIEWADLELKIHTLASQIPDYITSIHGIPRGGLIPAVMLSHKTGIPMQYSLGTKGFKEILIVDDIYDTGHTMDPYIKKGYTCAAIVTKDESKVINTGLVPPKIWVMFPWETDESSKIDYLGGIRKEGF